MKRCAFLTMNNLGSYVNDDEFAIRVLKDHNWDVQSIPWRNTEVDWNVFDVVVIRSPWDYMEAPELFLDTLKNIEASSARLENSFDIVKWNIDKRYLLDLERRGIHVVPTVFGSNLTPERLAEITTSFGTDPFIVKPTISASAKNTFHVTLEASLSDALLDAFKNKDYMVQPFMHRIVEEGEFSLFYFNGSYSHCIRKVPKRDDFRVQEEHGGILTAYAPPTRLIASAQRVIESLNQFVLYARVDLVQDENGDYALMELELIEPSLYLRMDPQAPKRFASALDAIPF